MIKETPKLVRKIFFLISIYLLKCLFVCGPVARRWRQWSRPQQWCPQLWWLSLFYRSWRSFPPCRRGSRSGWTARKTHIMDRHIYYTYLISMTSFKVLIYYALVQFLTVDLLRSQNSYLLEGMNQLSYCIYKLSQCVIQANLLYDVLTSATKFQGCLRRNSPQQLRTIRDTKKTA